VSRRPLLRVFCPAGCRLVKIYAGPGGAWVVADTRRGLPPPSSGSTVRRLGDV